MKTRKLTVGSLKTVSNKTKIVNKEAELAYIKEKEKFPIKVIQNNKNFIIKPLKGQTLLDAAVSQGQSIDYKCKKGTCGKCTVKVIKGSSCLEDPTMQEQKKLDIYLHSGYRLACQSIISCN
ncbi:MAG: 2Fe-2S iron-sulfur cluster-binding protein [Anaerobacillus sp.]|uniref:2Fe-2S iron-sulfur cluster-binding protein n=1 Tax=Anaerobacillus sp. TaxID=1872506 RepID=UPI00391D36CD